MRQRTVPERIRAHWQRVREEGMGYIAQRLVARTRDESEKLQRGVKARLAKWGRGQWRHEFRHEAVIEGCRAAVRAYRPGSYDGSVLLLRAKVQAAQGLGWLTDDVHGWGDSVRGPLKVVAVAGDHTGIVGETHAAEAAQVLRKHLAQAIVFGQQPLLAHSALGDQRADRVE